MWGSQIVTLFLVQARLDGGTAAAEALAEVDSGDLDALTIAQSLDDLAATDVHGNVVGGPAAVVGVEDEVAGLQSGSAGDPPAGALEPLELAVGVMTRGDGDGDASL